MSAISIHTEVLEVTGFEDKSKKFGTLHLTVITYPDNAFSTEWKWLSGPDGYDNGVFTWKQKLLELYSTMTNPKSFVWAVVNHDWKLDGRPLPRTPPWFSDSASIHIVNEEEPPYREFRAKPKK